MRPAQGLCKLLCPCSLSVHLAAPASSQKTQRGSKAPPQAAVELGRSVDEDTAGSGLTDAKPVLRLAVLIPPDRGGLVKKNPPPPFFLKLTL